MDVRWHASTEGEAGQIRALFPSASIEIALDQVCLPDEPLPAQPGPDGPARLVFISRISPMKNLDLVLAALQGVRKPVEFDVYGPAEDARYMTKCRAAMEQLPPHVRARYLGELPADQVRQTFSRYDAFVFPTRGENFGHVIGESLSASCPVVCSDETPWSPVLTAGAGAVVEPLTVARLQSEIEQIASMSPTQRLAARRLAGTAYRTWRAGVDGRNILDDLRLRSATAATSRPDDTTAHAPALERPPVTGAN
jgi:glycosyltransferase involved in cell wall biosynthesis